MGSVDRAESGVARRNMVDRRMLCGGGGLFDLLESMWREWGQSWNDRDEEEKRGAGQCRLYQEALPVFRSLMFAIYNILRLDRNVPTYPDLE